MLKKIMFWFVVLGCINTMTFNNRPIEGSCGLIGLILYAYVRKILKERESKKYPKLQS